MIELPENSGTHVLNFDPHESYPSVLFMRHAQTVANRDMYYLGQANAPLSPLGQEQAERAIEGLIAYAPDRIVTSPLDRCLESIARPAASALGVDLIVDERIQELDFGPLEGMDNEKVDKLDLPTPWGNHPELWPTPEGGEAVEAFLDRIRRAGEDLQNYEGRTAVVCHGGVMRGVLNVWSDIDFDVTWRMVVANVCSIRYQTRPGYAALERFGLEPELLACLRA